MCIFCKCTYLLLWKCRSAVFVCNKDLYFRYCSPLINPCYGDAFPEPPARGTFLTFTAPVLYICFLCDRFVQDRVSSGHSNIGETQNSATETSWSWNLVHMT